MSVHTTPTHVAEPPEELGRCALSPPEPVVAGQFGTWTITYTAGRAGVAPGGGIAVVPPCHNGVRWRVGHVVAATTGRCGLSVALKHCAPLSYHNQQFPVLFVTVEGAPLAPSEEISVTLGDPGAFISGFFERARAQDFAMRDAAFQVLIDPYGNARYSNPHYPGGQPRGYRLLHDSPTVDVRPGPPRRLAVVVPSRVAAGERFDVLVRAEDEYENPCTGLEGEMMLGAQQARLEGASSVRLPSGAGAVRAGPFTLRDVRGAGPVHLTAQSLDWQLLAVSNPIEIAESRAERLFFGDLHAHAFDRFGGRPAPEPLAPHGFGSYDEAYAYAREVAGLDFLALATFPSPDPEHWPRYLSLTRDYHEPGRFVPFPAVELSDRTAGHRVVVFPADGAPDLQRGTLPDLWHTLEGAGAIAIPHHPNASSEGGAQSWDVQDWSKHHPRYQPVVELVQTRGAFERDAPDVDAHQPGATTIGGRGASVQDALALGHRLGFVGGTDNHYAQPGSTRCPKGGVDFRDRVTGGLTAVLAPTLTREAVLAALLARRCYATTGARMIVEFRVEDHGMGEEFETAATGVRLTARVTGDGPLARLDVIRNGEIAHSHRATGRVEALSVTLPTAGETTYFYLRAVQRDRQMAWSSPVWATRPTGATRR
ncbi:MAG: CehA/McbA family metallohydrolase [Chloroflexota bacterium]